MKATAAVLSGKNEVYVKEVDLPEIGEEELLVKVVSNSVCLSTYKAAIRGGDHKRVPDDVSKEHPVITGHEFGGYIVKVGEKLKDQFEVGEKFVLQPAMGLPSGYSAGYSYEYYGGNATYCIIPKVSIDLGCVLPYKGDYFANASLAEPMSCIIGAFHSMYHSERGVYEHKMGIVEGGKSALLASCGPMGLGAISYMLNCDRKPSLLVITDIDEARLKRASELFTEEYAKERGVEIHFVNTAKVDDPVKALRDLTGGTGFDDVSVYAPVRPVIEMADEILGFDGCLNFFAGPVDPKLSAMFNFFDVHYKMHHLVGSSGGNTDDMRECLKLAGEGRLEPAVMITHIGGIDAQIDTVLNLPKIPGGKKLIYLGKNLELTAIDDFEEKGKTDDRFKELAKITKEHNGLWSKEAEDYLLANF